MPSKKTAAKKPATVEATLGGRILMARDARGLTVSQVSRLMGVLPKTFSNWETDSSEPRFNQLHRLAAVLHVPPMWLIGGSGDNNVIDDDEATQPIDETAGLSRKLDRLTDMHAKMATLIFETQSELRRLQNRFEDSQPRE
ncbi:MAG: helix-turn-helix domain-containing protein [Rhodospirillales bacterium]